MDYEGNSLKSQMRCADKSGSEFTLIIGEDEIARDEAVLRDMKTKEQINIKFSDIVKTLKEKLAT